MGRHFLIILVADANGNRRLFLDRLSMHWLFWNLICHSPLHLLLILLLFIELVQHSERLSIQHVAG